MLVSDEGVWRGNSLLLGGRRRAGPWEIPKGEVAASTPSLNLLLCQNAIDN